MASMDLKEFVSQTLIQICEGVTTAKDAVQEAGGVINPSLATIPKETLHVGSGIIAEVVEFDVAVTVSKGTGTKGGIGIFVAPLALGSQGESKAATESISRIKFKVSIVLPSSEPHS